MKAVFKDCIKGGKIDVPAHLRSSFSGLVTITLDDQGAADRDENRKDDEAVAWFQRTMGTIPPFTPLTREEANDRSLE